MLILFTIEISVHQSILRKLHKEILVVNFEQLLVNNISRLK